MTELNESSRQKAIELHKELYEAFDLADPRDIKTLCILLLQKRQFDGLNGRQWAAGSHLYFEELAAKLLEAILQRPVKGEAR